MWPIKGASHYIRIVKWCDLQIKHFSVVSNCKYLMDFWAYFLRKLAAIDFPQCSKFVDIFRIPEIPEL